MIQVGYDMKIITPSIGLVDDDACVRMENDEREILH